MSQLNIIDVGSGAKKAFPASQGPITLGTSIDCDVVLAGPGISGHHCRLELKKGQWRVVDLDSDSGTLMNGMSVGSARFDLQDVLQVGQFEIRWHQAAGAAAEESAAPPLVTRSSGKISRTTSKTSPKQAPRQKAARVRTASNAAAVSATVIQPKTRRKSSAGSKALIFIVSAALLVLAAMFANRTLGQRKVESTMDWDRQLAAAYGAADDARFEDAKQILEAMKSTARGNSQQLKRFQKAQDKVETQQNRFEEADLRLREAQSLFDAGDVEPAIRKLERIANGYSDVIQIHRSAVEKINEWNKHRTDRFAEYQGLLSDSTNMVEIRPKIEMYLGAQEFAHALLLSTAYKPKSDEERRILEMLLSKVEREAEVAGKKILNLVDEFVDEGELFVALNHLADADLQHLRGTIIWYKMLERADEIETLIDEQVPEDARPVARRTHRRVKDETVLQEIARTPVMLEDLSERGDPLLLAEQAINNFELDSAEQWLSKLLTPQTPLGERDQASQLMQFVTRPKALAEQLARDFAVRPPSQMSLLELRSGEKCKFVISDGTRLTVSVGESERSIEPLDLTPQAFLKATARLSLEPDGFLNRACVAVLAGDDPTFLRCIDQAVSDQSLGGPINMVLARYRGFDTVPPRGFEKIDDRWLTFPEAEAIRVKLQVVAAIDDFMSGRKEAGEEALEEIYEYFPEQVSAGLLEFRDEIHESIVDYPEREKIAKLRTKRLELDNARNYALELIYDKEKYFYPYRPPECPAEKAKQYPAVQKEVDDRVAKVRDLWSDEFGDDKTSAVNLSSETHDLLVRVHDLQELLKRYAIGADLKPDTREFLLLPTWTRRVSLRTVAMTVEERDRIDSDQGVVEHNRSVQDSVGNGNFEQVVITNDYRVMMGRRRLAHNSKIQKAAEWHSQYQSKKGELTHFEEENPDRRTPQQRMAMEDYDRGAGENCSMGRGTAMGAHLGWCHSSGHHRNLLWEGHTEMASALVGAYWTQNFGGGSEYLDNLIE